MSMYIRKMSFSSFSGFLGIQEKILFSYSSWDFEFFFFVYLFLFFLCLRCNCATLAYASVGKEKKGLICP